MRRTPFAYKIDGHTRTIFVDDNGKYVVTYKGEIIDVTDEMERRKEQKERYAKEPH